MPKIDFLSFLNHFRWHFLACDPISRKKHIDPQFSWWFLKDYDKMNIPKNFQKISMVRKCPKLNFCYFEPTTFVGISMRLTLYLEN